MIWLVISSLAIVIGSIWGIRQSILSKNSTHYYGDNYGLLAFNCGCVGLGLTFFLIILPGLNVYPSYVGFRKKVITLKNEISAVKSCHYEKIESGGFIGGSLDNMKQANKVLEYVQKYAELKAEYNNKLIQSKIRYQNPVFRYGGFYFLVDERIMNLEPIE